MKVRIIKTILEECERGIFEYINGVATIYVNSDVCNDREDIIINSPEAVNVYFTGGNRDLHNLKF